MKDGLSSSPTVALVLGLVASILLTPCCANAQGSNGPPPIFIEPIDPPVPAPESPAINSQIATLLRLLDNVQDRIGGGKIFELTGLSVVDTQAPGLKIRGDYRASSQTYPPQVGVADSRTAHSLDARARSALDRLLRNTLFHPQRGPFGVLKIANCEDVTAPGGTLVSWNLSLSWSGEPGESGAVGFEQGMPYELGRLKSDGAVDGWRLFLPSGGYEETSRDSSSVSISVYSLMDDYGRWQKPPPCVELGESVLVIRYYEPAAAEVEESKVSS